MQDSTVFEALGCVEGLSHLVDAFYTRVSHDPVLLAVYLPKGRSRRPCDLQTFRCARENLTAFLVELTGGPPQYSQRVGRTLAEAHARFKVGPKERDAWVAHMAEVVRSRGLEEPYRGELLRFFEEAAAWVTSRGRGAKALPQCPAPQGELAARWVEARTMEEFEAVCKAGDIERALTLTESPALQRYMQRDLSTAVLVLACLGSIDTPPALDYVSRCLRRNPGLVEATCASGCTLLHRTAASWATAFAALLLGLGAEPDRADQAGHPPLYHAANVSSPPPGRSYDDGRTIVDVLVRGGADPNAAGGVQSCTALHMAARRGNVALAEALLDCGADLEAVDVRGDTPLRRAVNCARPGLVGLLISRGANPQAIGSQGLTPGQAARTPALGAWFSQSEDRAESPCQGGFRPGS